MPKSKKDDSYDFSLFNRQLIEMELANFTLSEVPDLDVKKDIIKNWNSKDLSAFTETGIDGEFFNDFFTIVLDYQKQTGPSEIFNIAPKRKVPFGGDFPDASIGFMTTKILKDKTLLSKSVHGVVELKNYDTDLDKKQTRKGLNLTPVEQAFKGATKFEDCRWIIVSNYKEIRLYPKGSELKYEQFYLKDLLKENIFKKLYFLLNVKNLIKRKGNSTIDDLYKKNLENPRDITDKFYENYKKFRILLFNHLLENNNKLFKEEFDEFVLLEKVQKILDRVIFIAFCRDHGLLPYDFYEKVYTSYTGVWNSLLLAFETVNKGYTNKKTGIEINEFNGGLFAEDKLLSKLIVSDDIMQVLRDSLISYNFKSQLNINILGYIFEQSISDIDEIKKYYREKRAESIDSERYEIEPLDLDSILIDAKSKSNDKTSRQKKKRVYEGIFYTPIYITKYITNSAIERWMEIQKWLILRDMNFDLDYLEKDSTAEEKVEFCTKLLEKLKNIKILDPACGSGAFLLQAFNILMKLGKDLNDKIRALTSKGVFADISSFAIAWAKDILKQNLYGVDINFESVEITKLSLWLKTANKKEPLTFLEDNIKQGNSIIEDNTLTPLGFYWKDYFPNIIKNNGEEMGFDIIIGNPPYDVLSEKETGLDNISELNKYFKKHAVMKHAMYQKSNLYKLFTIRGASLLKENGIFSFIVPMSIMGDKEANTVRKYLFKNFDINYFEAFPQKDDKKNRVFEHAKLSTCIFQVEKNKASDKKDFYVRIHPGKEVSTPMSSANIINFEDVKRFDENLFSIPISTNKDWVIIKKILSNPFLKKTHEVGIEQFQGEVNETIINRKKRGVLSDSDTGYEILRGASITRYAVRRPSQGGRKWIDAVGYLDIMKNSEKAKHYRFKRVGFQRSAPQNNYRRLIAAPIERNYFCFDTVSYVTEESCSIELDLFLIYFNSQILEWYFRNKSTNSKINEYQFKQLFLPVFDANDKLDSETKKFLENGDLLTITDKIQRCIKDLKVDKYPGWIKKVLLYLCDKANKYEQARPIDLSKKNRAFLADNTKSIQTVIDDILFLLYGIDSTDKAHIRNQIGLRYY